MPSPLPASDAFWQHALSKQLVQALEAFSPTQHFAVGCSGGRDSLLLAYLLAQYCPTRVSVWHVDHQLSNASPEWAMHVAEYCQTWNIPYKIIPVHVAAGNIEQQARTARYAAFEQLLTDAVIKPILVLGHHQQDQAETTFLRLMSGSGVRGLAAMRVLDVRPNITIWRPLLTVQRAHIDQLLALTTLHYVNDPANQQLQYDRVFLRQQVWGLLEGRFSGFETAIARTADLMRDATDIMTEVVLQDTATCIANDILDINHLKQLTAARQRLLLSRWMQGDAPYAPARAMVISMQDNIINARQDANPKMIWQSWQFRRYQQQLYRVPLQLPIAQRIPAQSLAIGSVVALPSGHWQVVEMARGFAYELLQTLTFEQKQGGESFHFKGRAGHWLLKKQLHAIGLPTWQRDQVHLLTSRAHDQRILLGVLTAVGFLDIEDMSLNLIDHGWGLTRLEN